jgi:ribosomal protein S7
VPLVRYTRAYSKDSGAFTFLRAALQKDPLPELRSFPSSIKTRHNLVGENSKLPATLHEPTTNSQLLRHFSALLTRHGSRGEPIIATVQQQLSVRYGVPDPILTAINALKPVIKYYKSKSKRVYVPLALYPRVAQAMAMRWIIQAANARTFIGDRPNIRRGLFDEIDAIIQGTSGLFVKRFNTHRNPN